MNCMQIKGQRHVSKNISQKYITSNHIYHTRMGYFDPSLNQKFGFLHFKCHSIDVSLADSILVTMWGKLMCVVALLK